MPELADIVRRHGPAYRQRFQDRMPSDQLRALRDIERCRTPALGGQLYRCPDCGRERYSYHSCRNRHCPKCGHEEAQDWLERQQALLLPVTYHLLTFTLPEELRPLVRSHPRQVYPLIFAASLAALLKLARDERFLGAQPGLTAVLHTWTRALLYHPHLHVICTGGGYSQGQWKSARSNFLVPVQALSRIYRAKFRDALQKECPALFRQVPPAVWKKPWVVHSKPVGSGRPALIYLSRYVFRVALSNGNLLALQNSKVTFRYRRCDDGHWQRTTVTAEEFLRRFLQHVLPSRFVKIRHYGLHHPRNRPKLEHARVLLAEPQQPDLQTPPAAEPTEPPAVPCPCCGRPMRLVAILPRGYPRGPPS